MASLVPVFLHTIFIILMCHSSLDALFHLLGIEDPKVLLEALAGDHFLSAVLVIWPCDTQLKQNSFIKEFYLIIVFCFLLDDLNYFSE